MNDVCSCQILMLLFDVMLLITHLSLPSPIDTPDSGATPRHSVKINPSFPFHPFLFPFSHSVFSENCTFRDILQQFEK